MGDVNTHARSPEFRNVMFPFPCPLQTPNPKKDILNISLVLYTIDVESRLLMIMRIISINNQLRRTKWI